MDKKKNNLFIAICCIFVVIIGLVVYSKIQSEKKEQERMENLNNIIENYKPSGTKNMIDIVEFHFEQKSHNSDNYRYLNLTLKNKSDKNIQYVKYNIIYTDSNGKQIDSDWGNSDKIITPSGEIQIEKMCKKVKSDYVEIEIVEAH